jgi:hypothetical protein
VLMFTVLILTVLTLAVLTVTMFALVLSCCFFFLYQDIVSICIHTISSSFVREYYIVTDVYVWGLTIRFHESDIQCIVLVLPLWG